MESSYRPTRVEISLDALQHNIQSFRQLLPKSIRLMAVVKANAYGHGAIEIAQHAIRSGADYLGVAFLDEAIELRRAKVNAPILILGYTPPIGIQVAYELDITLTLYDWEGLAALRVWSKTLTDTGNKSKEIRVHIKADTGMGRLGLHEESRVMDLIQAVQDLPNVQIEGLYTHYACADETVKMSTYDQYRKFSSIVQSCEENGWTFPYIHAGNSAIGFDLPNLTYNMLRLGISMYGLYPSEEVQTSRIDLQPVMSFITSIVMVKQLPAGANISYGATYQTKKEEWIATLPVGYADGYSRMLTGKTEVLLHGRRVPVVGRICMDQCMIAVDAVMEKSIVSVGDEVILFGKQGEAILGVDELARQLGTINYEVTCMVNHRVPRVYLQKGRPVKTVNFLQKT